MVYLYVWLANLRVVWSSHCIFRIAKETIFMASVMLKLPQILVHQQIWLENFSSSKLNRVLKISVIQWTTSSSSYSPPEMPYIWLSESQNSWGWKGPLEVTCSKPPAQAGPPRTGCAGHLLDVSNNGDSTIFMGNLCQCAGTLCFLICRPNLCSCLSLLPLSCDWTLLKRD